MNLFVGAVVDNFNRQTKKDHHTVDPYKNPAALMNLPVTNASTGDKEETKALTEKEKEAEEGAAAAVAGMVTPGQKAFMNSVGLLFSRKPITRPIPPSHDVPLFAIRRRCYNMVMWGPIKNGKFLVSMPFLPVHFNDTPSLTRKVEGCWMDRILS